MKIKGALIFLAIVFTLAGCSSLYSLTHTIDDQYSDFGRITYSIPDGLSISGSSSVQHMREDYKRETGKDLPVPDTLACGSDGHCYFNTWVHEYDSLISEYRSKKQQAIEESRKRCLANPECARKSAISHASQVLNVAYRVLVFRDPYLQAQYDDIVRTLCKNVGERQREGISKNTLVERAKTAPGIAPIDREWVVNVVTSCWDLSNYGVEDGGTKIHFP